MKRFHLHPLALAVMTAGFAHATPALAQDNSSADKKEVEEVIVTIDRREQSLQDFAGTAQAFSPEDLAQAGVGADFQSLQAVVPGLQISFNEGFQEIFIRGIGSQLNNAGSDQPTAVHYNGAYIPKMRGLGPVMFDLERVEVNQGPQGTLRGRNATAGSINILPKLPEIGETGGKFKLGVGNFDSQEVEAAMNVALGDNLAARFAYFAREHDNYYNNKGVHDGPAGVTGTGSEDEEALRMSVLWEGDVISGNIVYDHMTMGGSGFPGQFGGQVYSTGATISDLDDPWDQFFQTQGKVDNTIDSLVLTVEADLGDIGAEAIISQRSFEGLTVNPRRPFQYGFVSPEIPNVAAVENVGRWENDNYNTNWISDDNETTTAELRFFSDDDSALYWTAGIFMSDEAADEFRWDTSDRANAQTNLGGPDYTEASASSLSIYADATYEVSDTFRVKGGIRFTDEEKEFDWWEAQVNISGLADITDIDGDGDTAETYADIDSQYLRFSTPGFDIVDAGDQSMINPLGGISPQEFMNTMVRTYGGRDTWGDILAAHAAAGSDMTGVITTTYVENPGTPNANGIYRGKYDDSYMNFRLGFEMDMSDESLLYGTLSTGTRSGGVNTPVFSDGEPIAETFEPEELTSLEVGSKNTLELAGNPLTFNASLFYYMFDNQLFQVGVVGDGGFDPSQTNVAANLQQANVNVGESTVLGLTLDGALTLPQGFELGWNILLSDSEIKEGYTFDGRQGSTPPNINVAGNKLLNSSDVTAVIDFGQELDVDWGEIDWTLTASYRSSFHATPFENRGYDNDGNEIPLADMATCCGSSDASAFGDGRFYNDKVDATLIWNFTAGTTFGDEEQYRLEAYVQNLTEEAYAQKQIINHYVNIAFLNTPRTAGVRFSADF